MTAIVALVHAGQVWMGADSATTQDGTRRLSAQPKIAQRGPLLLGATGSIRHVNLLHSFTPPAFDSITGDTTAYITGPVVDALRAHFKDAGTAVAVNGQERAGGASFLIGCRGRLYLVDNWYGVVESRDAFDALGSGGAEAWGALYSTQQGVTPGARLWMALDAAAHRDSYVAPPFTILCEAPDAS